LKLDVNVIYLFMPYKLFFALFFCLFFSSCDQILSSIAKEQIKSKDMKDSLTLAFNEKPISLDTMTILERKGSLTDSFYLVKSYFLTGQTFSECWQHSSGAYHGLCKFFFPNGKMQYAVDYKFGKPYTLISSYDEYGKPLNAGDLKNGNGSISVFHPLTYKLIYTTNFKDGDKEGAYVSYYSDGRSKESATFKKDTLIGDYIYLYHSGKTKETLHKSANGPDITLNEYNETGAKVNTEFYHNAIKISSTKYDERGNIIIDGKLKGNDFIEHRYYYNDSNKLLTKTHYKNLLKEGEFESYYENGVKKSSEIYIHDTLTFENTWYDNGKTKSVAKYKNGLLDGLFVEYYYTGNKKTEQIYVKGLKNGAYTSYFNNGNKYNVGTFENDELKGKLDFYSEKGEYKGSKEYK
jgi:antitoxin component YwqK of YwqJK toxin-antitoxin module